MALFVSIYYDAKMSKGCSRLVFFFDSCVSSRRCYGAMSSPPHTALRLYGVNCASRVLPLRGCLWSLWKILDKRPFFQQERDDPHIHDAVLVCPRLRVAVHDDDLAEEVARVPQREGLLASFRFGVHIQRRLYVHLLASRIDDEVNLVL